MAFFKKRKAGSQETADVPSLTLAAAAGTPWLTFPGAVVRSYRHMLARLTRTEPWPQRLALVSTLREEGVTYSTSGSGDDGDDGRGRICLCGRAKLALAGPATHPQRCGESGAGGGSIGAGHIG
ncbi:MAG: hypothetical protein V9G20_23020 [Candidatus Promineifilaceae bacterium]